MDINFFLEHFNSTNLIILSTSKVLFVILGNFISNGRCFSKLLYSISLYSSKMIKRGFWLLRKKLLLLLPYLDVLILEEEELRVKREYIIGDRNCSEDWDKERGKKALKWD